MSLAGDVIQWIEGELLVPRGPLAGAPFALMPWQRRFIRGAFQPGRESIGLTVARNNGKSGLIAALGCAGVAGPLRQPGGEVLIVAPFLPTGRVVFDYIRTMLEERNGSRLDGKGQRTVWAVRDTPQYNEIIHRASRASVRVMAANPRGLHGRGPVLTLVDEPAQFPPNIADKAMAALTTAGAKVEGRIILFGTRPASEGHFFARWLETAHYAQIHAAGRDDPPHRLRTWRKANPSLGHLPLIRPALRKKWALCADGEGQAAAEFGALHLNQGIDDTAEPFVVSPEGYKRAAVADDALPPRKGPGFLGLDLASAGMAGAAMYWPLSKRLETCAAIPGEPPIEQRERDDHCRGLYTSMVKAGQLHVQPGHHVIDVEDFLRHLLQRWGRPALVVTDSHRRTKLEQSRLRAGMVCEVLFRRLGLGPDGIDDLDGFVTAWLSGAVRVSDSDLGLASALGEARVRRDTSGNACLARRSEAGRRARARDDILAAALLSVSSGWRWLQRRPPPGSYRLIPV